ncbi:MAG: DNA polymerase III subunit delta' [Propionibacteriaceae bacterium]|jgi:DNA polymerase-3 subunit delta'|nr:DNA polymerase III subunit delta' [Propionibacteriaceae bacterium]
MSVWDFLIGQAPVVAALTRAIQGATSAGDQRLDKYAMTHAWLITGPPGSGRSVAARAFAAGLECAAGGCGQCKACATTLAGTHPDVTVVRTERLSIGVDEVRDLVRRSAMSPTIGSWQVIIIEDADRVTERGADALLKAIEEPAAKTIWVLCAPTADDVIMTVRSRCRAVNLVTPATAAIAALLVNEGIDQASADFAARVCQGHIGRARLHATNPEVATHRRAILDIPAKLVALGPCLELASWAVTTAKAEAEAATAQLDAEESQQLNFALGLSGTKGTPRGAAGQLKDLEEQQALRAKRFVRDRLDTVLLELTSYYRDVLVTQTGAADLTNTDYATPIAQIAAATTPEATLRCLDAIADCRQAIMTNVAPLLAFEALMVSLWG